MGGGVWAGHGRPCQKLPEEDGISAADDTTAVLREVHRTDQSRVANKHLQRETTRNEYSNPK